MTDRAYEGGELGLFAAAIRWKRYVAAQVRPYLGRRVLEVGAGFGGSTAVLCDGTQDAWVCLEPDPGLAGQVGDRVARGELPAVCRPRRGVLADLDPSEWFDSILYLDVLEHIEDDAAEAARAAAHLAPGGHLVVLAPAHQRLFTPFDAAIGHYRRYDRRTLAAAIPAGLERVRVRYLDSVGLLASLANRLALNQSMPTARQIAFWDGVLVRTSRVVDGLLGFRLGKSVLGVWRKPG